MPTTPLHSMLARPAFPRGADARGSGASGAREATAWIIERVRGRLRAEGIDPHRHGDEAQVIARAEVRQHNDFAQARGIHPIDDEDACVREVLAAVGGLGPLQPYLDDPRVEELWINAPDRIFVARDGVSERTPLRLTEVQVRDLVERMLHASGRRVDLSSPFVDASLADGSRLHVVIPDVTRAHWSVNIRRFHQRYRDLDALVALGSMDQVAADLMRDAAVTGRSILVSGATQAGKTTLLAAILASCADTQRIITVEETFELAVDAPDVVALQGRQPSLEGTGEVTLRRLVKEALRMRPDRLVIGEVRDAEALDLVLALNTGIPGTASIHANSASAALVKLTSLPLLAGRNIDTSFVREAIASSVHLVVHCSLGRDGMRRVDEIVRTTGRVMAGTIETQTVWSNVQASRADSEAS